MKNIIVLGRWRHFLPLVSMMLFGCSGTGKGDYKRTVGICGNLYVEVYRTFGKGALGSDRVADYLTDSSGFRLFIGEYDEYYGAIRYYCHGDSFAIEKLHRSENGIMQINETKIYGFRKLEQAKNISKPENENISDKHLY